MDARLGKQILVLGGSGVLLQTGGVLWAAAETRNPLPALEPEHYPFWPGAIVFTGSVLLICGLALYARAKGRTGWWGLMGLVSIPGLLVLALLPDLLPAPAGEGDRPHLLARVTVYLGVMGIIPLLGLFCSVLAVVCGVAALVRCKRHPEFGGRAAAITGMVLGCLFLVLWLGASAAIALSRA